LRILTLIEVGIGLNFAADINQPALAVIGSSGKASITLMISQVVVVGVFSAYAINIS